MCEDCGCQEGNERAYFSKFGTAAGDKKEVHIHVHVHIDGDEHVVPHLHVSPHHYPHDHDHGHHHGHVHNHEHSHAHDHAHSHEQSAHAPSPETRTVVVERNVLAQNDQQAAVNRDWLAAHGAVAVNLISSPGSGKTTLLERTLERLNGRFPVAVITGDQQTDNDARRMMGKGAKVVQIETRSSCHLNAAQVHDQLEQVVTDGAKLLLIENVGNLVCPAAFDLGERHKIALVSLPEGEDKPVKYPVLFHDAPVAVITKTDLLPHLDVKLENYKSSILQIRPDARIFEVSAKTGEGLDEWIAYLVSLTEQ